MGNYNSMLLKAKVINVPHYRMNKYVVARLCRGELWFYGSYVTEESAKACVNQLGDMALILIFEEEDVDDRR